MTNANQPKRGHRGMGPPYRTEPHGKLGAQSEGSKQQTQGDTGTQGQGEAVGGATTRKPATHTPGAHKDHPRNQK